MVVRKEGEALPGKGDEVANGSRGGAEGRGGGRKESGRGVQRMQAGGHAGWAVASADDARTGTGS